MKYRMLFFLLNLVCTTAFCQNSSPKGTYPIPDSINAVAYYAEIKITENGSKNDITAGIIANDALLALDHFNQQKSILFGFFDKKKKQVLFNNGTYRRGSNYAWKYDWQYNETYPLLIATASDSAANKTQFSGYIYLPAEKKWKLIATRSFNDTLTIKSIINNKKTFITISNRWLQRDNGTWKALDSQTTKPPSLRQMSNIDSLLQQQTEEALLRAKLKDSAVYEEGMFYQTLKEGTGRLVKVTDTLTVHYRGSLYSDGSVFDETKDKPATFPLERLIKGWQIGLLHCKVGGKMRLYLPSGSAYGIRTRSAEIPPNSILVFDVEVLDAKEKVIK
jgi:FKBP-type peptidyl-prolyl cis-trans isomerase FkpA